MDPDRRGRRLTMRVQGALSTVLVVAIAGLLAFLSQRYAVQVDWTAAGRNTLSAQSNRLLDAVDGPIRVTAYAREDPLLRGAIRELIERYRRRKADISLEFLNPDRIPERTRQLGITTDGELVIEHAGRSENVPNLSESAVTIAISRLVQTRELWVVYVTGHGERDLLGRANHHLGAFGDQLTSRGLKVQPLNLLEAGEVPEATGILVLTQGTTDLLAGEVETLGRYLDRGGNLLWLADPGPPAALEPIARRLGIAFRPGTVVDPTARVFGIDDAANIVVTRYEPHPVTAGLDLVTVFPHAAPVSATATDGWQARALLSSARTSWLETGALTGEARFDAGADTRGPFDVGIALTRKRPASPDAPAGEQRIAVVGDGDFLSNSFLGNGGNLDLGLRLVRWLTRQDSLIEIPARATPDAQFELPPALAATVALGALIGIPGLLLAAGVAVWFRRRRR